MAVYRVRFGDTLSRIANAYSVTLPHLIRVNPQIGDPDRINVGDAINVPDEPVAVHASLAPALNAPLWYRIARRELASSVVEVPGPRHNERILEYHRATTLRATDDETPWCSSFVNWCLEQAGLTTTRSAAARSWLRWGEPLGRDEPKLGCIVIFERPPSPTSGHVGFFEAEHGDEILVLGGNQGDRVSITAYPRSRWIGYRWPTGVE